YRDERSRPARLASPRPGHHKAARTRRELQREHVAALLSIFHHQDANPGCTEFVQRKQYIQAPITLVNRWINAERLSHDALASSLLITTEVGNRSKVVVRALAGLALDGTFGLKQCDHFAIDLLVFGIRL